MESTQSDSLPNGAVEDHIQSFLDEIELYGRAVSTVKDYETTLRQFEEHLHVLGQDKTLAAADRRDCLSWIQQLRDEGYAPGSIHTKAIHLNRFYAYMAQIGEFSENPMVVVIEELNERGDSAPTRRDVSLSQMQSFVDETVHPLQRAVVLTLVKTGIRAGELCNLDFRDVSIDHTEVKNFRDSPPRAATSGHPDTLFIDSSIDVGTVVNGERRKEGNKRHRDTLIPIDKELKDTLIQWLSVRPDPRRDSEPLFVNLASKYGERLTTGMVHSLVRNAVEKQGWYKEGAGPEENVTPHYFRHFFTTEMRNRIGDAYAVKYIRGDVGDVMDRYTHNWEELVEQPYRENVFTLTE